jgi:hypothetical protein
MTALYDITRDFGGVNGERGSSSDEWKHQVLRIALIADGWECVLDGMRQFKVAALQGRSEEELVNQQSPRLLAPQERPEQKSLNQKSPRVARKRRRPLRFLPQIVDIMSGGTPLWVMLAHKLSSVAEDRKEHPVMAGVKRPTVNFDNPSIQIRGMRYQGRRRVGSPARSNWTAVAFYAVPGSLRRFSDWRSEE